MFLEGCGDIVSDNEIIQAALPFDLGGKTMKKRFLITVLGLTMGSALLFSGCGSKKDTNKSSSTVAESTSKAGDSSAAAESTTAEVKKVDINYELANNIDVSYDDIGKIYGDPASDDIKEDAKERVVKYNSPERELYYFDDGDSGYLLQAVSGKAGDILSLKEDKVSLSDVMSQLGATEEKGLESNNEFLTVGDKGESTVLFEAGGYHFLVSSDKDKNVSKDSAVVMFSDDKVALDNAGAQTKASEEAVTPGSVAAESTTAKK